MVLRGVCPSLRGSDFKANHRFSSFLNRRTFSAISERISLFLCTNDRIALRLMATSRLQATIGATGVRREAQFESPSECSCPAIRNILGQSIYANDHISSQFQKIQSYGSCRRCRGGRAQACDAQTSQRITPRSPNEGFSSATRNLSWQSVCCICKIISFRLYAGSRWCLGCMVQACEAQTLGNCLRTSSTWPSLAMRNTSRQKVVL